ncbi:hypothetical protein BHE74_00029820 [Ensete ventricosum]|nr:hypothetical protein GW17_00021485 [Ensete ventricosum]RWW63056.1 hypothetical protein BHE74_00029820 [Ensete ventricosum]
MLRHNATALPVALINPKACDTAASSFLRSQACVVTMFPKQGIWRKKKKKKITCRIHLLAHLIRAPDKVDRAALN